MNCFLELLGIYATLNVITLNRTSKLISTNFSSRSPLIQPVEYVVTKNLYKSPIKSIHILGRSNVIIDDLFGTLTFYPDRCTYVIKSQPQTHPLTLPIELIVDEPKKFNLPDILLSVSSIFLNQLNLRVAFSIYYSNRTQCNKTLYDTLVQFNREPRTNLLSIYVTDCTWDSGNQGIAIQNGLHCKGHTSAVVRWFPGFWRVLAHEIGHTLNMSHAPGIMGSGTTATFSVVNIIEFNDKRNEIKFCCL